MISNGTTVSVKPGAPVAVSQDPDTIAADKLEMSAVACAILDPASLKVLPAAQTFRNLACRRAMQIARTIHSKGGTPDSTMVEVLAEAQKDPEVGAVFLADVQRYAPTAANAPLIAQEIRRLHQKRTVAMIAQKMLLGIDAGATDMEPLVTEARAAFEDLEREAGAERPRPISFGQLVADHPHLAATVIDGWLREGETGNIIAAPKVGKSWLAYLIALTVATGGLLFGKFPSARGRILLVDNELFPALIHHRIAKVAKEMGIEPDDYRDQIDVLSLRGQLLDIHEIALVLAEVEKGEYSLVILDALYRAEPAGQTENDNSARMRMYNLIDSVTAKMGSAWLNIHHASKGDQSGKAVVDVGAGAGSQARAADTHIVLRQHEEPGVIVLEGAVRSFAPIEPLALRWEYPLWVSCTTVDASRLKGRLSAAEQKQSEKDRAGKAAVFKCLDDGPATAREVRRRTGMNRDRTERYLDMLEAERAINGTDIVIKGNPCRQYSKGDVVCVEQTT